MTPGGVERRVHIAVDPAALAAEAAAIVVRAAQEAVAARGRFTIARSGGETARSVYEALAAPERAREVDWSRAEVYWGDERCVAPDDERSNYGLARDALLRHVAIPPAQIHRMPGEHDPSAGAAAYERLLRNGFGLPTGPPTAPVFDINHMGMGEDGHTASLFPGVEALHERERWVMPTLHRESGLWRLTLTPPVLNASRLVLITVTGAAKAARVREAIEGESSPDRMPVRVIEPKVGALVWLLDEAAASRYAQRH